MKPKQIIYAHYNKRNYFVKCPHSKTILQITSDCVKISSRKRVISMDSASMGRKLRTYRAMCALSIDACAERIGIGSSYLADIERGAKVPKLATFLQILNVLSASADDVLQDSLVIGYEPKSSDIIRKLNALNPIHKKQALDIFDYAISRLEKGRPGKCRQYGRYGLYDNITVGEFVPICYNNFKFYFVCAAP